MSWTELIYELRWFILAAVAILAWAVKRGDNL